MSKKLRILIFLCAILAFLAAYVNVCAESPIANPPKLIDIECDPYRIKIERVVQMGIMNGYPDGTFRPKRQLTEGEFAKIIERLLKMFPKFTKPKFDVSKPKQPMTRIRAITVLIRAVADPTAVEAIGRPMLYLDSYGDFQKIPSWGLKYAAYALDRGYIIKEPNFRPNDPITRAEVAGIIARSLPSVAMDNKNPEAYTGLVIDTRGLGMKRMMNAVIMTESGFQIYPDVKNLPSLEYLEEYGLAAFVNDISKSKRAGARPLIIKAKELAGPAKDIVIIADCERGTILEEEEHGHFLANWNVTFLID